MFHLNDRVLRKKNINDNEISIGTIRFLGEISNKSGEWIGVEWDNPIGKNNGIIDGKEYFHCQPKHGSFIRQSAKFDKLEANISLGEAVRNKYSCDENDLQNIDSLSKTTQVDFVGMKSLANRFNNFKSIRNISVHGTPVSHCLPTPSLSTSFSLEQCHGMFETMNNLKSLDISKTTIKNWSVIIEILNELPNIRSLDCSYNRLTPLHSNESCNYDKLEQLHVLALTCSLAHIDNVWSSVVAPVLRYATNLKELYVARNRIEQLDCVIACDSLRTLDLSFNKLKDWPSTIESLANLKSLETLDLSNNKFNNFSLHNSTSDTSSPTQLSCLKTLVVDKQEPDVGQLQWNVLDGLRVAALPSLCEIVLDYHHLKIDDIMLLSRGNNPRKQSNSNDDDDAKSENQSNIDYIERDLTDEQRLFSSVVRILVALRPSIERVNRSAVSKEERHDAELDFLAHIDQQRTPQLIDTKQLENARSLLQSLNNDTNHDNDNTKIDWISWRYAQLDAKHSSRFRNDQPGSSPSLLSSSSSSNKNDTSALDDTMLQLKLIAILDTRQQEKFVSKQIIVDDRSDDKQWIVVERRVPHAMRVSQLLAVCRKTFDLKRAPRSQTLFSATPLDNNQWQITESLSEKQRDLAWYGLENGNAIVFQSKK